MSKKQAAALDEAHRRAIEFLDGLDNRPVWPVAGYSDMLAALGGDLPDIGLDPAGVIAELAERAGPGLSGVAGSRFFGFVIGGGLPAALAADWLTSTWDQNGAMTSLSPAASAVETIAGDWLVELFGLPTGSAVGFVTGAMMANFSCLAAARRAVLDTAGWDLSSRGLTGSPATRIVVGQYRHSAIDRALRLLGFGLDELVIVPSDSEGRMIPDQLDQILSGQQGPLIVCLQAGEVHTGAFDDFGPLIEIAHRHGGWVHVDGAFGLWAAACESTRQLTSGVEAADSWTTDAHKTLNVPYDSGLAIVRDPGALRAVFGSSADYLVMGDVDPFERTPEMSRRARGFAVWAALRSLGRNGVDALVGQFCANATRIAAGLADLPDVEVLNDVVFTQVLASFGDDARTRSLGERLLADGVAAMTPGIWHGRAVQRFSMSNWSTTAADIDTTLAAVRRMLDTVDSSQ